MLIGVHAGGRMYTGTPKLPNLVEGVPEGERVTALFVGRNVERCDFAAEGGRIVLSLPAIRRIRNQAQAA